MLFPNLHQAFRLRKGQWPYQHKIRQGKDSNIGADADGDQQNRGQGEPGEPSRERAE